MLQVSNKALIGTSLAILMCPAPNGKMFGVTVDRADLERVQSAGFWRVANFGNGHKKGGFALYCYTLKNRRMVYMHRFLLDAPKGVTVDHAHHRNLDNRRTEIRLAPGGINQANRRKFRLPERGAAGRFIPDASA